MKGLRYFSRIIAAIFIAFTILLLIPAHALASEPSVQITEWQMKWINDEADSTVTDQSVLSADDDGWITLKDGEELPIDSSDIQTIWLRFQLPQFQWDRPALLLDKISANQVTITINDKIIYHLDQDFLYNKNSILVPLNNDESGQMVYIETKRNFFKVELPEKRIVGEHSYLDQQYKGYDLLDAILGASLLFIATILFVSMFFLNKAFKRIWGSLTTLIFAVGVILFTYSSYSYTLLVNYEIVLYYGFDFASSLIFPAMYFFFEAVFGRGPLSLITRFKWLQVIMFVATISVSFAGLFFEELKVWYFYHGQFWSGIYIVISNLVLLAMLVIYSRKRNKDAIIIMIGLGMFISITGIEVAWYIYKDMIYRLVFWKFGVIIFIISLVVILARRIMKNYEQVIEYSNKLELFNNELQRSERMQIISQLAASVAHEVRNPLQVTRGFLQILGEKTSNNKDKEYMNLAIEELDRASEIITDFLTFAKPQMESITMLNIAKEIEQIVGILLPLATMQGGVIHLALEDDLYIRGNASKFKQALINILKNSIEAFGDNGEIYILAYEDKKQSKVIVRIKDNGEGMTETDIARLGEPYYSKKTKGTGLGLMVTFRIIEAMEGELEFQSRKGMGTEAILYFPLANKEAS